MQESVIQPPKWYHDVEANSTEPPLEFPLPQLHPSKRKVDEGWKQGIKEQGPVGLLILAALRAGLKLSRIHI